MKRLALACALALACSASRPERYESAATQAEKAYAAGRYEEAAKAWLDAAKHAEHGRDASEARYRAAASYERAKRLDQADRLYEALAREPGERSARAAMARAELARRQGQSERAKKLLLEVIRLHSDSGPAAGALADYLRDREQEGGKPAALAAAGALLPELEHTELDERVRYARARLLDELGETAKARDAYLDAAARHPYPEGALWDDALYRAALCEDKLGRTEAAIAILERLLGEREQAHVTGSYERSRYAEARFKIAELARDRLHDPARARREFHRVWTDHETSLLRDDALFEEALLARQSGDQQGTCSVLRLLQHEAPDSRFAPCAPRLCPELGAPAGRRCHDYLIHRLEPKGDPASHASEPDDDRTP